MNNDPTNSPDYQYDDDLLQDALDNQDYKMMIMWGHPLSLEELAQSPSIDLDRVNAIADKIGWPDPSSEDGKMIPLGDPMSDMEFMETLLPASGDDYTQKLTALVNFLTVDPAQVEVDSNGIARRTESNVNSMDVEYGSQPYYIRAYAVAPNLIDGLKQRIDEEVAQRPVSANKNEVALDVMLFDHQARRGINMFYRIMGRLVRTSDPTTHMRIEGFDNFIARPIEDPDKRMRGLGS